MKKTLRFLSVTAGILLSVLFSQKATAQVTAINVSINDSFSVYCNTPANVTADVYFGVGGTPDPLDSLTVYINYGDGTDLTYKIATTNQGWFAINHTYNTTGSYQISVTLTNTNSISGTTTGQIYNITNTCSALNGQVFIDDDNDCTYDVGEQVMNGHMVAITNTTTSTMFYVITDANGFYYAEVPDGFTYEIEIGSYGLLSGLTYVCPLTGVATQAVSGMGSYTHNFGLDCASGSPSDVSVWAWANNHRPGHVRPFSVHATTNNFCNGIPATVTVVLNPLLTYDSHIYGPVPASVVGQTITWNVASLSQLNNFYSTFNVYTDPTAILGSYLCSDVYISYTGVVDTNLSNDTFQICKLVSNAWDPNNKEVSPMVDAVGSIENGELLHYVINFQNTGNDTAYNVVVVDTLSNNLDVSTFQLLENSHPVNVTWLSGNIINFRFENIYLPDSNINEPASHGHVVFNINAKTGLADGAVINNTAHIYFDFNPAIVTNTTVNTIEIPTSVQNITNGSFAAKVFPNPANNELIITTEGKNFSAQVFDIVGRTVATSITNNGNAVINTSSLANGMYILTIKADGKEMTTKINVQH